MCRKLKEIEITRKRLKKKAAAVFTSSLMQSRKDYAREVLSINNNNLLFLDESGFNLHLTNHYGYSPVGVDAIKKIPSNRGKNLSLILLISSNCLIEFLIIDGAFNSNIFIQFLNLIKPRILEDYEDSFIIIDNAKIHQSEIVNDWIDNSGLNIKYLPAYSLDLNPIENVFGTIKQRLSTRLSGVSNFEQYKIKITEVLHEINNNVSMEPYYRRMREFIQKAYHGESF